MFTTLFLTATAGAQEPVGPPEAEPAPVQTFLGALNPQISFNGLFIAGAQLDDGAFADPHLGGEAGEPAFEGAGESYGTGLNVQEMELQLRAAVDPYFNANVVLAVPGTEGIEVEEGYVQLVSIPRTTITIGKIKEGFGRENLTHTHALLTVDKSLVGQALLGGEGLNDVGVNAAFLLPTPWYSEILVSADRGSHAVLFNSGKPAGFGYLAHWKNLLALSYETSVELGVSGAAGQNDDEGLSKLGGVDITVKSHGRGSRQRNRLIWQSELMFLDRDGERGRTLGGVYSTVEYSLTSRVWLGGRYDYLGIAGRDSDQAQAATAIFVYAPTEFSAVRVQAQRQWAPAGHTVDSVVGQLNFTIGAHPAHSY
ncbi:MAG: hypothetical protein EXR71_09360 [Myxococcales bacterium]|nr:hypothetical protein [Myxococcales bacterium]